MVRIVIIVVLVFSSFYSFGQSPFTITLQPVSPSPVCSGVTITMTIRSNGNSTRYYQWQKFNISTGGYDNLSNGSGYTGAVVTNSGTSAVENAITSFSINTAIT